MNSIIGIIGAAAFAVAFLPQLIKVWRTHSAGDLSTASIVLNIIGNVCCAVYVFNNNLATGEWQTPLYFNYGTALIIILVLFYYKKRF